MNGVNDVVLVLNSIMNIIFTKLMVSLQMLCELLLLHQPWVLTHPPICSLPLKLPTPITSHLSRLASLARIVRRGCTGHTLSTCERPAWHVSAHTSRTRNCCQYKYIATCLGLQPCHQCTCLQIHITSFQPPRLIRWSTCTSNPFAGW
jgi:hypothetical protein